MSHVFARFFHFCAHALQYFLTANCLVRASSLAYMTLIALVPVTMVAFGLFSAFPAFSSNLEALNKALLKHLVPASADIISHHLLEFANQASRLSIIGLVFSILTAILLIHAMNEAFNEIWRTKHKRHNSALFSFLLYWAMITLLPLAVGAAFATSIYFSNMPSISSILDTIALYIPIFHIIPFLLTWASFILLYIVFPNTKVAFKHAAIGAAIAALFFEIFKTLFGLYVTHFSSDFFIYGALATIPILLVWIYISWIIVLFGSVITFLLQEPKA